MIPLNYHHLYYFHAIAQEGGVAKAARALFLAQPTLSAQSRCSWRWSCTANCSI